MTRGKGEGSVYKRASDGLWCVRIELPKGPMGERRTKVVCRKSKTAATAELNRLRIERAEHVTQEDEPMTLERAVEMILAAIEGKPGKVWRGTSRRRQIVPPLGGIRAELPPVKRVKRVR